MSVSLVVFRLEVADDCGYINLRYNAPQFECISDKKVSYAEAASRPGTHKLLDKEHTRKHKGRREFLPIAIETYLTAATTMAEAPLAASRTDADDGHVTLTEQSRSDSQRESDGVSERNVNSHSTKLGDDVIAQDKRDVTGKTPAAGVIKQKSKSKSRSPTPLMLLSTGSLECVEEDAGHTGSRPGSAKTKGGKVAMTSSLTSPILFFSGNPAVETTEGIIHLYKDHQMTSLTEDVSRSEMICMVGVPAGLTSHDLLNFAAPVAPWVEHIKIIRDGTPNQYMVLLKFRSQKYADDFYKHYNNEAFNSLESDICHLVYVAKVETVKSSEGAALPIAGLTELPVCPVCLERMDESVDGILTILCNHSFHGSCLSQWGDTSCPVCRYVQTPEAIADNKCFLCEAIENLWICLICGNVGCGRYVGGHAYRHFQETNHTYSMQLENNRVWDYAGDNYVHRLVQNKGDGKLVEVNEGEHLVQDEKLDSITLEYTYLLTSQLESQRHYFEEKIERVEKEALAQVEEVEARAKKAVETCTRLEVELATATKERQTTEKKCASLSTRLTKLTSELGEEREMNRCLRDNQAQWQEKVLQMEKQLETREQTTMELQDQLRDVMFYLEAQQKVSNTDAATQQEIQEGHIVVQPSGSVSGGATGGATSAKKGRKKTR